MSENITVTVPSLDETIETIVPNEESFTAYKIATFINKTFEITGTEKRIPTQMMYNYARNGMINKVKGCKAYTRDEVIAFVKKYTSKHI